jgi:hypothetical protein
MFTAASRERKNRLQCCLEPSRKGSFDLSIMRTLLIMGMLWMVLSASLSMAGSFVAPAAGPVPFRRDRLPLDADTMSGLSRQMSLMAKGLALESAPNRRAAAQAVALAIALDPANREARDFMAALVAEKTQLSPAGNDAEQAKTRVWQIISWLESSAAGADGQALGACLTDAMVSLDPTHPKADTQREKGEIGRWVGWVAEPAAYDQQIVAKRPVEIIPEKMPIPAEVAEPSILRKTATVSTPIWSYDKQSDKMVIKPMSINMKAWIEGEGKDRHGFTVRLEGAAESDSLFQANTDFMVALKSIDHLPNGGRVSLMIGNGIDYLFAKNGHSISAAAAVLADAAVSGRDPHVTVMGIVNPDGSLRMPSRAWDRLRSLLNGSGGRLVMPKEAETLLISILVMEDPAFFMKYEVILVDNLKELIEFSGGGSQSGLNADSLKFAEIREKMGGLSLSHYVAMPSVHQRLGEIAQSSPMHFSARMLALHGGASRPTQISKQILASEVRRALEPMTALSTDPNMKIEASLIDTIHETCRASLDPLGRYVDVHEGNFYSHAQDMLVNLRTLGRIRRSTREINNISNAVAALQAFNIMKMSYMKVCEELSSVADDEEQREPSRDVSKEKQPERNKEAK